MGAADSNNITNITNVRGEFASLLGGRSEGRVQRRLVPATNAEGQQGDCGEKRGEREGERSPASAAVRLRCRFRRRSIAEHESPFPAVTDRLSSVTAQGKG